MKRSDFRLWVDRIWQENSDEHFFWGEKAYTKQEYFKQFKYWLKREYRYQTRNKQS